MALGRAATDDGVPSLRRFLRESPEKQTARIPRRRRSFARRRPITHWPASLGPFGAGYQPAVLVRESNPRQPDSRPGALTTELTSLDTTLGQNPFTEHTPPTASGERTGPRAPLASPRHCFEKDAGGSRTHLKLLCRQPPCRLAPASGRLGAATPISLAARFQNVLARSRTWSTTFAGSRANPPHSEDVTLPNAPPRNRTSITWVQTRRLPLGPAARLGVANP